jgi:hypothetical protein
MLQYLLKLTISLSIVYLFYQLFLRRLTFYNWNRWYLLIYSMVCFVIPFINVFTIIVNRPALRESVIVNYIPAITQMTPADQQAVAGAATESIGWLPVAILVMATGMLVMIVRLLIQYYSFFRMRSKAVLLYEDKVKLYHIDAPVMPFSFGRGIYVNQHQHSESELKEIIRHEFIHVKQRHSLDILWSELLCILNWYNPFAWLLRYDIRQNLEFIADQQVLQTGLDRKEYQYLLLKVIGVNSFSIATNFNFSSLKRRIAMMNKTESARVHLLRFLFLLPLLVVVLLAFRNATQRQQQRPLRGAVTDTLPKATKEPPGWKEMESFEIVDRRKVTMRLKNGKVETYDLAVPKEKEAFEKKYGSLFPEPPTPPAPPIAPGPGREWQDAAETPEAPEQPEMKERPEATEAPEAPEPPEAPEKAEQPEAPVPPPPPVAEIPAPTQEDCFNKKGFCITVLDNYGECVVIVKDKNNKIVQAVTLEDWNKDKQYEEKYGEISRRQTRLAPKTVTGVRVKTVTLAQPKPLVLADAKPVALANPKPVMLTDLRPVTSVRVQPSVKVAPLVLAKDDIKTTTVTTVKPLVRVKKTAPTATVTIENLKVYFDSSEVQKPVILKLKPVPATKEP